MNDAVAELGELSSVPAVCCTYEVTCDALELVYVAAAAVRTFGEVFLRVLESAVHASVTVMVH